MMVFAVTAASRVDAQTGFHLTGTLTANDADAGYFEIGKDFLMMTPIRSPLYPRLTELVGASVELTIRLA